MTIQKLKFTGKITSLSTFLRYYSESNTLLTLKKIMANRIPTFIQKTKPGGQTEMRTLFVRRKALVLVKRNSHFYVNLYNNQFIDGKQSDDRIGLGMDELDQLIKLRPFLEIAKESFTENVEIKDAFNGQAQSMTQDSQFKPPPPYRFSKPSINGLNKTGAENKDTIDNKDYKTDSKLNVKVKTETVTSTESMNHDNNFMSSTYGAKKRMGTPLRDVPTDKRVAMEPAYQEYKLNETENDFLNEFLLPM